VNEKKQKRMIDEENAAKSYSKEKVVKIQELKGLHGSTQLYFAFKAGIDWYKNYLKENII
jgi:hypothetical protein